MVAKLTISDRLRAEIARKSQQNTTTAPAPSIHSPGYLPVAKRAWVARWREETTFHASRGAALQWLTRAIDASPPQNDIELANVNRLRAILNNNPALLRSGQCSGGIGMRNGVPFTLHLASLAVWRYLGAHGKY